MLVYYAAADQAERCSVSVHVDSVYNDFVVLQLHYGVNEKLVIGNLYRSPNNSLESDEEFYSLINSVCNNFNCKKICR